MTEPTPTEPSMPADAEPAVATQEDSTPAQSAGKGPGLRPKVLVWAGIAVVAVVLAVAAVFLVNWLNESEVGDCVKDTEVVSCADPHDARIVGIVDDVNGCLAPESYPMKEADSRYLCLVEEPR